VNEPRAPVLVLAVGNPSRGDDALGPMLAARIEAAGWPGVEVVTEFQLQVEHVLDLQGRSLLIVVDAAVGMSQPCELRRIAPQADFQHTTHALSPEALLATYERVVGPVAAETWLLCVRGESFELGEGLSASARAGFDAAWGLLEEMCRGAAAGRDAGQGPMHD
jgi:hydrogenase maturation protease